MVRECLILSGGLGTRLRSVVADRPKPMADVQGRPFITFLFEQLLRFGVERAVLCLGHLGEFVPPVLGERYGALKLVYSFEHTSLGTGGALRNARNLVSGHDILALNGDSFCDVDLEALLALHQKSAAAITLSVLYRADRKQAGALEVDESGRVVRFESRPSSAAPGLINAGVYALRRDVLDEIPENRKVSLEEEVLPSLVERKQLFAYRVDGRFIDIGTPENYNAATTFFDPTRIE